MKKIIIFTLALVVLLSQISFADDWSFGKDWTAGDTALEATFFAVTIMDWKQTREIHDHHGMYEENRYLGRNPDADKINSYFPVMMAAHAAIAAALPAGKLRTTWQALWIGIEVETVHHNYQAGLAIHF
jgi:hypothetical protein